jgi:hypothetical protein
MPTNTVANFAIKLGIDPSSIPADLRNVTVNLTTEQKRLAATLKQQSADFAREDEQRAKERAAERNHALEEQARHAKAAADEQIAEAKRIEVALKESAAEQKRIAAEALADQMHLGAEMNAYCNYVEKEKRAQAAATAAEQKRLASEAAATQMRLGAEMNAYNNWVEREKRIQAAETAALQKREASEAAAAQMRLGAEMNAYANWVEQQKRIAAAESASLQKRAAMEGIAAERALATEMNRTAQSGVLSFRMLSESMDLGLSRPVTRYLTQTFPKLSAALSSIVGIGAGGALAYFGIEAFDRVTQKLDEAKQKEEAYQEAVRKTGLIMGEAQAASVKRTDEINAKMAALQGNKKAEAGFKMQVADVEAVDRMAQAVEKLSEAEVKEARANQSRHTWLAAIGRQLHETFSRSAALQVEAVNDDMEAMGRTFKNLSIQDEIKGTTSAMAFLNDEAKRVNDTLEIMRANQGKVIEVSKIERDGTVDLPRTVDLSTPPEVIAALEKRKQLIQENLDTAKQLAAERKKQDDLDNATKAKDLAQRQADQLRNQLEEVRHLTAAMQVKAAAEEIAAASTGKGTIASRAAAAVEKAFGDEQAELDKKYVEGTEQKLAANRKLQEEIKAQRPDREKAALQYEAAKALEEYNRAAAEFTTHAHEHIAALDAEAAGHSRVITEQAREMEGLVALKEKYDELRKAYEARTPGTSLEQVLSAKATLDAAHGTADEEQEKTQANAIAAAWKKVGEELTAVGDASPWDKTEAKVLAIRRELAGLLQPTEEEKKQLAEIGAGMHAKEAIDELDKLKEKVNEAAASTAALASLSPFAKIEAEVLKAKDAYHLLPGAVDAYRNSLIALHAAENEGKAFEGVEGLSATGSKVRDLQAQYAALGRMQSTGQTSDGRQLSASELAAVNLEMRQITEEIDKIVVKTGDANAGFQAWVNGLQNVQSQGAFVLSMLDTVTKGAEDNAAKSIVDIIENYRGSHAKLIKELKAMWLHYFAELTEMAVKNAMMKGVAGLAGALHPPKPRVAGIPGLEGGPPLQGGKIADAGGLTAAGTSLQTAAAQLSAAAAALRAAAASGAGGAGGAGGLGDLIPGAGAGADAGAGTVAGAGGALSDISGVISDILPEAAEGGNFSPGSSLIAGEAGAERIDLGSHGGAQITPLGWSKKGSGGDTHYYDMRGSVVTDDLVRKADAARAMSESENRSVARAVSMSQDIARRGGAGPPAR